MFVSFSALKSFFEICALRSNDSLPKALERVCLGRWHQRNMEYVITSSPNCMWPPLCILLYILLNIFLKLFFWNSRCISSLSPSVSECPVDISSVNDCAGPDSNEPIKIRRILFVTVSSSNQIRYLVTPNAFFSHLPYHSYTMLHLYTFFFFFN